MTEKRPSLTVVDAADVLEAARQAEAARRRPTTISEALGGSALDVLWAMRRALAKKLDDGNISSNAIASAYKELRELDRQIRTLAAAEEQEARDRDASAARPRRSFDATAI